MQLGRNHETVTKRQEEVAGERHQETRSLIQKVWDRQETCSMSQAACLTGLAEQDCQYPIGIFAWTAHLTCPGVPLVHATEHVCREVSIVELRRVAGLRSYYRNW